MCCHLFLLQDFNVRIFNIFNAFNFNYSIIYSWIVFDYYSHIFLNFSSWKFWCSEQFANLKFKIKCQIVLTVFLKDLDFHLVIYLYFIKKNLLAILHVTSLCCLWYPHKVRFHKMNCVVNIRFAHLFLCVQNWWEPNFDPIWILYSCPYPVFKLQTLNDWDNRLTSWKMRLNCLVCIMARCVGVDDGWFS